MATCRNCGKSFEQKMSTHVYCKIGCREKYKAEQIKLENAIKRVDKMIASWRSKTHLVALPNNVCASIHNLDLTLKIVKSEFLIQESFYSSEDNHEEHGENFAQ